MRLIKTTRFNHAIIGICLFLALSVFFIWNFYLFYNNWNVNRTNNINQRGYRPPNWEKVLKDAKRQEDSLYKDMSIIDSVLVVLKRDKIKKSHEIERLNKRYLIDSLNLTNCKGYQEDLIYPGH